MRAFKFLGPGSVGLFSGVAWPRPSSGGPGAWVEAGGPLEPCRVGVHALRGPTLLDWMDDELWRVELAGRVIDDSGVLVAERGRLLTQVVGWDDAAARGLSEACIGRLRERIVHVLQLAGDARAADRLAVADAAAARQIAVEAARRPDASVAAVCEVLADAISLAMGTRPESDVVPHPDAAPSEAAVAANVAYVVAHTLAATDEENDYATAFPLERAWQFEWLADRLVRACDSSLIEL